MFLKLICLIFLLTSFGAQAYVENVTHGYVNCMACHVAPSGGGLLTDYGRSLSKELMSTWGWKGSERPLFGALKNTEHLAWGGDIRTIQTRYDNDQVRQGSAFVMQKNVEVGAHYMNLWVVATLGTQEGPKSVPTKGAFLSERHYLLWNVSDTSKLRAGKFRHHFGIYDPDHTLVTKAPLGLGSGSETYQIEFSHFSDSDEIFVTSDFGKLDQSHDKISEQSFSVNYARYLSDKSKLGVSYLHGETAGERRELLEIYSIFAPFEETFLKFETDFQQRRPLESDKTNLWANSLSFGHQGLKGFWPYLITEYLQRDLNKHQSRSESGGFGMRWFPIPHIELQFEYQRKKDRQPITLYSNSAWLIFHFYL